MAKKSYDSEPGDYTDGNAAFAARCAKVTGKVSGPEAKAFSANRPSRHSKAHGGPATWKKEDSQE